MLFQTISKEIIKPFIFRINNYRCKIKSLNHNKLHLMEQNGLILNWTLLCCITLCCMIFKKLFLFLSVVFVFYCIPDLLISISYTITLFITLC